MSLQICVGEYMASDHVGTSLSAAWLPTIRTERFVTSAKDGTVDRSPDQVPFIDTEILWTNPDSDPVYTYVSIQRAPRSLVTSTPNQLALMDGWSSDIGASPSAALPVGDGGGNSIRTMMTRSYEAQVYTRTFRDYDSAIVYVSPGAVDPGETLHFRYRCLFSTPGVWRSPLQPMHLAYARWARLRLFTRPAVTGGIA